MTPELIFTGSLAAEEITPPLNAAIAACQDELDAKQAPVAGFLAVRLTVSGDDGAVSDVEVRCLLCVSRGLSIVCVHVFLAHRLLLRHQSLKSRAPPPSASRGWVVVVIECQVVVLSPATNLMDGVPAAAVAQTQHGTCSGWRTRWWARRAPGRTRNLRVLTSRSPSRSTWRPRASRPAPQVKAVPSLCSAVLLPALTAAFADTELCWPCTWWAMLGVACSQAKYSFISKITTRVAPGHNTSTRTAPARRPCKQQETSMRTY